MATDTEQPTRLTGKQRAFCAAYLGAARFNASAAAQIAGYKHHHDQAWDVLNSPNVRAYVAAQLQGRTLSGEAVLAELTEIAAAEWGEFLHVVRRGKGGEPVEMAMDLGAKVKALELLARAHGLLTDKVQHAGELGVRQLIGVAIDEL